MARVASTIRPDRGSTRSSERVRQAMFPRWQSWVLNCPSAISEFSAASSRIAAMKLLKCGTSPNRPGTDRDTLPTGTCTLYPDR